MKKISLCEGWKFKILNTFNEVDVDLPHDALIFEERSNDNPSGTNLGWFKGNDYSYTKILEVDSLVNRIIEFEGVYKDAKVYLNDELICERNYGYTNFYVDITPYQILGDNVLRVECFNSDQPNSRWYSGAGIIRPVWLYLGDEKHILVNGIKVKPISLDEAIVDINTNSKGDCLIEVFDKDEKIVYKKEVSIDKNYNFNLKIDGAHKWSIEDPYLYTLKVTFEGDIDSIRFGFRTIKLSLDKGFLINDERVIIRGCCIHSDNGILGARIYKESEYRKAKILKDAGYNAIRSAHNPCSKYLLDACDELGILMMDEYVDMWFIHKTMYDYASHARDNYMEDLKDMVEKDYNHPSVVLYSLGNEVGESAIDEGVEFFKNMRDRIKSIDDTRPITAGINILFNMMYSLGLGMYDEEKAKSNPQTKVGSEFFNDLTGLLGNHTMKIGATFHRCDVKTKDIFKESDVAGYNYGILRYKKDLKKYRERFILGSETFCEDAYKFYNMALDNPRLIGDFVWAGMDYLGEVGIGSWEYKDYAPNFKHVSGWISAGSGRVNLIGSELCEALYTKAAFNLTNVPEIGVVPINHTNDKHSPSAWKFSNAVNSWSFNGFENKPCKIEVYSRAPYIKLLVNDKCVGTKKLKNNSIFYFKTKYRSGSVTAIALDENKKEISRNSLYSANDETILSFINEADEIRKDQVVFIKLRYTDNNGILKPLSRGKIKLDIKGAKLLALGHACPYNEDLYNKDETDTYYGEALCVIKVESSDLVEIHAKHAYGENSIILNVL